MKRTASAIGSAIGGLLVLAFLLLTIKGCVVRAWSAAEEVEHYVVVGGDGRVLEISTLPNHEVLLWYTDPNRDYLEGSLQSWKGTEATHYFGRLWRVEGPGITFGYRLYPPGFTPIMMEQTTLRKYSRGTGRQTFPDEGERGHEVLLFSDDSLLFAGMKLQKVQPPTEELELRFLLLGEGS